MAPARLVAVVVALATAAGCKREPQLVRRELPGFSILVPDGKTMGTPTLEYASGYLAIAVASPIRVAVMGWSAGSKMDSEQTRMMLQLMAPMVHSATPGTITTQPGPTGTPVETMEMKTDALPLLVSQVECGRRNLWLATGADSAGDDFHRRLLMSLLCKPDPAAEATLSDVRVALQVDLPGWYAASRDDGQLQLTNGTSAVVLQPMAGGVSPQVTEVIAPALNAAFHGSVTVEAASGGRVNLHGSVEGSPVVGWAKLIPCPASKTLVMALAPDQAASDEIDQAFARARCLPPGAPAQKWPDPPADEPGDPPADGADNDADNGADDEPAKAPAQTSAKAPAKAPAHAPR